MIADFEFKSLLVGLGEKPYDDQLIVIRFSIFNLGNILQEEEKERNDQKQQTLQDRVDAIEHEKKEQWRQEGKKILFQAKREGVALQLEAVYRQNVINFYNQVKNYRNYFFLEIQIKNFYSQKYVLFTG